MQLRGIVMAMASGVSAGEAAFAETAGEDEPTFAISLVMRQPRELLLPYVRQAASSARRRLSASLAGQRPSLPDRRDRTKREHGWGPNTEDLFGGEDDVLFEPGRAAGTARSSGRGPLDVTVAEMLR